MVPLAPAITLMSLVKLSLLELGPPGFTELALSRPVLLLLLISTYPLYSSWAPDLAG
jgi:hypothetical protein